MLAESGDVLAGVRIASTARAVADTAWIYRKLEHLRAMVTSAIQRELCTAEMLTDELAACPRQRSALLRRALADVFADVHSVAEAEAADLLRAGGVPDFLANAPIVDTSGRLLYRVDLLWPQLRAIVEIDSREFHLAWAQEVARWLDSLAVRLAITR